MKQKLPLLLASCFVFSVNAIAQTVSSFDDLTLPSANTDYATSLPSAQDYVFQSGQILFAGTKTAWGGYMNFNYSNVTDTVNTSFTNDRAAVTGKGANGSANYGVAYVNSDWPANPTHALPISAILLGTAANEKVVGCYITNTAYAYGYMRDFYTTGDFLKLVIKGYSNGVSSGDSVTVVLGELTATDTVLVKSWEWVNLLSLGDPDSLTFEMYSSDDFTPFYFAIDDIITLDGVCPQATNIMASTINENSATITWQHGVQGYETGYDIAIDQSATLAPTGNMEYVPNTSFTQGGLQPNTVYYVHLRTSCGSINESAWDTISIKTLENVGIDNKHQQGFAIQISPNPATDYLHLQTDLNTVTDVFSMDGKLLIKGIKQKKINIMELPSGLYLLKSTAENGAVALLKFIKQ